MPTFALALIDAFSGPSKKAQSAVEKLEAELRALDEASKVKGLDDVLGKSNKKIESLNAKLAKVSDPAKKAKLEGKLEQEAAAAKRTGVERAIALEKQKEAAAKKTDAAQQRGHKLEILGGLIEDKFGKKVARSFEKVTQGNGKFIDNLRVMDAGVSVATEGLVAFGGAALAVALPLAAVVGAGAAFALDMGRFKESTEFAMKFALGSASASEETFGYALKIAQGLGGSVKGIAPQIADLLSQGFGAGDAEVVVQAVEDLKAMGGKQTDKFTSAIRGLSRGDRLTGDTLNSLRGSGLNVDKVYSDLAAQLKITGGTRNQIEAKVNGALASSNLKGNKGVKFLESLVQKQGGGPLGSVAKQFTDKTIDGSIQKVTGSFENLFASLKGGGAGEALVALLQKVAGFLNTDSDSGKLLQDTLNKMGATAAKLIGEFDLHMVLDGFSRLIEVGNKVIPLFESFGSGLFQGLKEAGGTVFELVDMLSKGDDGGGNRLADSLKNIGVALGYVVVGVGAAIGGLVYVGAKIAGLAAFVGGAAGSIGLALIDGITGGLDAAKGKLVERLESLAALLPDCVRKLLKIQSPSKVFADIGRFSVEGLTMGIDAGAPRAEAAMGSVTASLRPDLASGAVGGGGARGPVSIVVHVDGSKSPHETAHAVVDLVADKLELIGIEMGML